MELTRQAQLKRGVYWIVFPTYGEAKDAVWRDPRMLFDIIPEKWIEKTNESELVVYFTNGSILQLKGADEPDSLRGAGPLGVVFDEFAKVKIDAWYVVEPILRANGGWAWFVGTPKGKNHLYHFYLRGQERHIEWSSYLLKASQSGIIAPDQLNESQKTMTQADFNQEWECEFLEGAGQVFRGVRDICNAQPKEPKTQHTYIMGVDLAKHEDYTVIAVYDRATNAQVYQNRFNTIEWPFQKKRIKAISDHYNKALIAIDATGIGDPIADDLARVGLAVEPIKFTEPIKKQLIEKLSIWIEQKKISLLPIEETINEFENFSYEIGETGRRYYGAPHGFNDDIVIAQALACWVLNPIIQPAVDQPKTRIRRSYEKQLNEFYHDQQFEITGGELDEWGQI